MGIGTEQIRLQRCALPIQITLRKEDKAAFPLTQHVATSLQCRTYTRNVDTSIWAYVHLYQIIGGMHHTRHGQVDMAERFCHGKGRGLPVDR